MDTSGWNLLALVGYDLGVAPTIVIRPFGGLGIFEAQVELCVAGMCDDDSESEAVGAFGGMVLASLGSVNLGGELRVIFADESALVLGGNVGFSF